MKKLTVSYWRWLKRRARNSAKKRSGSISRTKNRKASQIVEAWTGSEFIQVRSNGKKTPPRRLCFDEHPDETLQFFASLRKSQAALRQISDSGYRWLRPPKNGRGLSSITYFTDYSKIDFISTSAAVVLTAEYERLAELVGSPPPTINLADWSNPIFQKLYELGFFELVGLTEKATERYLDDGLTRTLPIISGKNATELEAVSEKLFALCGLITDDCGLDNRYIAAINTALGEAMANVAGHAYPCDAAFELPHIGKWWITATVDRVEKTLTVVIYDQGLTIPVTFPKQNLFEILQSWLPTLTLDEEERPFGKDGYYIEAAMKDGRTQTDLPNRGLGIPQMKEVIDIFGHGRLSILSRNGRCDYDPSTNWSTRRSRLPSSVGGTLIEWAIKIPENKNVS